MIYESLKKSDRIAAELWDILTIGACKAALVKL